MKPLSQEEYDREFHEVTAGIVLSDPRADAVANALSIDPSQRGIEGSRYDSSIEQGQLQLQVRTMLGAPRSDDVIELPEALHVTIWRRRVSAAVEKSSSAFADCGRECLYRSGFLLPAWLWLQRSA